jgi:hypothetical protein
VDAVTGLATAAVRAFDGAGILVDNIEVRQPSLDDVFFSLTGGHLQEGGEATVSEAALGSIPADGSPDSDDGSQTLQGARQ